MIARRSRLAHRTRVETAPAVAEITLLLPWHASGALDEADARRVDAALRCDPALAAQYAEMTRECAEVVALNSGLGEPSPRVLQRLFAAIDADDGRPALPPGSSVHPLRQGLPAVRSPHPGISQPITKKIGCCV